VRRRLERLVARIIVPRSDPHRHRPTACVRAGGLLTATSLFATVTVLTHERHGIAFVSPARHEQSDLPAFREARRLRVAAWIP